MNDQLLSKKVNILSVVGTTSSGKTDFALRIANDVLAKNEYKKVIILSADSKQVYKGIEILTGADIPAGFERKKTFDSKYEFFQRDMINLCGISMIEPNSEWSVAHFQEYAHELIKDAFADDALLICVGGTGLYQKQLTNYDKQLYIKPNIEVRDKAKKMSLLDLQNWLKEIDPNRLDSMNNSDVNNSRRLVRAIEISLAKHLYDNKNQDNENLEIKNLLNKMRYKKIGLEVDFENLEKKIKARVNSRILTGALEEVEIASKILNDEHQAFTAIGFKEIMSFLKKEISSEQLIDLWSLHEFQYAKKQLLWWKNQPDILWLDDFEKTSYTLNK